MVFGIHIKTLPNCVSISDIIEEEKDADYYQVLSKDERKFVWKRLMKEIGNNIRDGFKLNMDTGN